VLLALGCSKKKDVPLLDGPVYQGAPVVVEIPPAPPKAEEPEELSVEVVVFPDPILFAFDDYRLTDEATHQLDRVADAMTRNPGKVVMLYGACCPLGSAEYNLALGEHRGLACGDYLVSRGVSDDRIAVLSWGEEEAHLVTSDPAEYWRNRRAEIEVQDAQ
jgi:peptidoglycan-associated lipoprotein